MRSYKAARRAAKREPVKFEVVYGPADAEKTAVFTCAGEVSALMLSDLAANADISVDSAAGISLLSSFFMEAFGVSFDDDDEPVDDDCLTEYRRFRRLERRHLDEDQLLQIMADLVEDLVGRPIQPSSDSPTSPSADGESSRADSSPLPEGVIELPGGFRVQAPPADSDRDRAVAELEALASSG